LLAYTLLLIIPISFQGTLPYLDSSWAYDLNYYLHSRFRFGPDLVFTYGPLGFLNNPQHVAHDIRIAVIVHAAFLAAVGWQLFSIWKMGKRTVALVFCVSLALAHHLYYDYFDYSVMALGLITIAKLFRGAPSRFDLALLPVLIGVSFLLKSTAFLAIVLMLFIYAGHLFLEQSLSRRRAGWLALCVASGPIAYLIYDISPIHLAQYVKGSLQIATGYTTAMSLDSDIRDWRLFAVVCSLLAGSLLMGLLQRRVLWTEGMLVVFVTWTVFRHGFVRGGGGHAAMFFGFSILVFAVLFNGWDEAFFQMPFLKAIPQLILLLCFAVSGFAALSGVAARYLVLTGSNWWPKEAFNDIKFMLHPAGLSYALDHGADSLFAALPGMALRSSLEGRRVMVFPYSTPYVAKFRFEMFPIYSLQDYQAVTAFLDKKSAANLAAANPPVDKVLLEWGDIDGRNEFLDGPAMALAIFSNFTPQTRVPDALLLTHRQVVLHPGFTMIGQQPFRADDWVPIPARDQLVAMSIRLKQNLIGTLVTNLYDQAPVYMELGTRSGAVLHYRVPPQVLSTPGIINYVPNSLDDLEKLWKPEPLTGRVVKIRLTGPGLRWVRSDGYRFYEVENTGVRMAN